MIDKEDLPEISLPELGNQSTKKPQLSYDRIPSQAPITQADSSLISAVFFRDTTIGSLLKRPEATAFDPEENSNSDFLKFVPQRHLSQFDAYALVTNENEAYSVMRSVDEENERTRMVSENPWKSFALNLPLQYADPVNWFPAGVIWNNVQRMSRAAKGALQAGTAGLVSGIAQETVIQGNQLTREIDESIINPLASGAISAVLGGLSPIVGPKASKLAKGARQRATREMLNVMTGKDEKLTPYGPAGSAGAMAHVSGNTLAKMPKFVQKGMVTSLMNDMLTNSQDFQAPKDVAAQLFQNNYTLLKNESGTPSLNAESQIKLDISKTVPILIEGQNLFFKQAGVERGLFAETRANKAAAADPTGRILNWEKFESETSRVLFTGETHQNASVNEYAKLIRENIFDPRKDALIELGLLPEGITPKNSAQYLSVHWNQPKIKENQAGFLNMTKEWFYRVNDVVKSIHEHPEYKAINLEVKESKSKAKAEKGANRKSTKEQTKVLEKELAETAKRIASQSLPPDGVESIFHTTGRKAGKLRKALEKWEIDVNAQQTLDKIIGNDGSRIKSHIVNQINKKTKPMLDRSFLIPQRIAFDWQLQSASDIARNYVHALDPVIRMTQMAKEMGHKTIADWHDKAIEKLREEMYRKARGLTKAERKIVREAFKEHGKEPGSKAFEIQAKVFEESKGLGGKEALKLDKAFKEQSQNITNAFELLLGIYGDGPNVFDNSAAKYYKAFLNWNYIRLLGFMTLSAIPDMGLHVLTHGPVATLYHGLKPVLKSAFGFAKNMSKDDLRAIGYACNTVMGTRLKSMAGHEGLSTQPSFFGRTFDKMVDTYGNVTLMNQWNDIQQNIAGTMSINRILKAVEAHANGTLSHGEQVRLARLGIDVHEYATLHDLWKRFGGDDGGTYFANWTNWEIKTKAEAQALQSFQRAVATEIDSVVIVPGLGDKPLIAQTNLGKLLLQFKSFAFAATNKILFAGIQRRHDMNTYFGMATMLALGSLSYLASQAFRGNQEIDLSFKKLAHEAIDRSGLLGVLSEVYNLGQKAGLGFGTQASRYQSRSLWGALLGPSTGAFDEMLSLVNSIRKADGEHPLTTKDFEKLLRLAPYQNLFYTYYLSRKISGALAPKLGFAEAQDNRLKGMFK